MARQRSVAEHDLILTMEIHQLRDQLRFPLGAEFRWCPGAPLDVELTFHPPGAAPVTWILGRDLLTRGVRTLVGEGDVRIRPASGPGREGQALLRVGAEPQVALFALDRAELRSWLEETWEAVPAEAEAERLDWAFLDALLAGHPGR
ncbi:SsgA family sporulation/cell division regulator [Streptomyces sp. NPDC047014]|uniref:SsgA family sporulation/cell division regulator n=1 Tax=Streptomyces sp. NPDC047014 TaxID=3155736 RepID=UPI0033C10694